MDILIKACFIVYDFLCFIILPLNVMFERFENDLIMVFGNYI